MPSPLERLYKTKFTLLAVVSVAVGLGLLFVAHWAATSASGSGLRSWPISDIGLGLFTTGLFGVLFQYVGQRDAEADAIRRIREVITDDLAAKPGGLVTLVSSETRDRIIGNCLGVQLGDQALAEDLYADLRQQFSRTGGPLYGTDISIALAPWEHGPASGNGAMFVATIRWEYRVLATSPVMRFACVSDLDEYRDLLQDPSNAIVHYFAPIEGLDGAAPEAFQLVQFTVNGKPVAARRTARTGSQVYAVTLGAQVMKNQREVTVSYVYQVLVQQHGHLLYLDVGRPSKGLKVQLSYGHCGIRYVNTLAYIASPRQPRQVQLPASGPAPSIAIGFDGWVLPKAGVGFVWVLESEIE